MATVDEHTVVPRSGPVTADGQIQQLAVLQPVVTGNVHLRDRI